MSPNPHFSLVAAALGLFAAALAVAAFLPPRLATPDAAAHRSSAPLSPSSAAQPCRYSNPAAPPPLSPADAAASGQPDPASCAAARWVPSPHRLGSSVVRAAASAHWLGRLPWPDVASAVVPASLLPSRAPPPVGPSVSPPASGAASPFSSAGRQPPPLRTGLRRGPSPLRLADGAPPPNNTAAADLRPAGQRRPPPRTFLLRLRPPTASAPRAVAVACPRAPPPQQCPFLFPHQYAWLRPSFDTACPASAGLASSSHPLSVSISPAHHRH